MAISATFELRENSDSVASAIYGAALKSYTVVDLDYTLKRSFDKTGRPSSIATIDYFKITIRGTKEITAKFHEWINGPDTKMGGVIKIYDTTGYASALSQDVTGGDTADYLDIAGDMATDEIEDNLNAEMDGVSNYNPVSSDIYDEMNRSDLLSYIASKGLDIETSSSDSEDTIREKIRYYNKISKMTEAELREEANTKGVDIPSGASKDDILRELAKYNSKNTTGSSNAPKTSQKAVYKAADRAKTGTSKTAASAANMVTKGILESARSITFNNAYCVSLREHFHGDPESKGAMDPSYPWLIEIGIRPASVVVNGWNMVGQSGANVEFKLFNV